MYKKEVYVHIRIVTKCRNYLQMNKRGSGNYSFFHFGLYIYAVFVAPSSQVIVISTTGDSDHYSVHSTNE